MDFDDIIRHLGDFGTYQKRLYHLVCVLSIFTAVQVLLTVFTFGVPEHRCAIPDMHNDTYITSEYNSSLGGFLYDNHVYKECSITSLVDGNTTKCNRWVYDKSIFESTIITQMDLVCDEKISKSHAQMLIMLGQVTGCAIVGPLSDRFGRKKMMCCFVILFIISTIAVTWTPTIRVIHTFFYFIGISLSGSFTPSFVLGMELVGPRKRVWTGMVVMLYWSLGLIILSGLSYWIRNWQTLQLVSSVPSLVLLSYFWFVAESPRWLIHKGRYKEAEKIINNAARVNKVVLPDRIVRKIKSHSTNEDSFVFIKILKSRILLVRILIVYFNWATCSLTFYGLGLNAGNLSGDIFLNFFLLSIIEVPAYVLCLVFLDRYGRRILYTSSLLLCGACITFSIFPVLYAGPCKYSRLYAFCFQALAWITTVLAVIGKLGVTSAFAIIWMYTSELFPTTFRNSAVGSGSMMARIAGAISPYIANIQMFIPGEMGKVTPMIIFGLTSIVAGLLALLLPETKNKKLPDTLEEAERFGIEHTLVNGEELKELK